MSRPFITVLLALVMLTGCGGGEEQASPAPATATAPPTRTVDQLAAALPSLDEVPHGEDTLQTCPEDDGCEPETASIFVDLAKSIDEADVQRRYDVHILPETVSVSTVAHEDAGAARASVADALEKERAFDGSFSSNGKEVSDSSYSFGEKGTGTLLEDTAVAGWEGHVGRRVQVLTSPEGGTDTPPLEHATVHVAQGNVTLEVVVTVLDDGDRDAEELARRIATEYVERLG